MSEESKVLEIVPEGESTKVASNVDEDKLVKQVIASQAKVDRFRSLRDKVKNLIKKIRHDMKSIKTIVNKEKRRKDSCLASDDVLALEDCSDL